MNLVIDIGNTLTKTFVFKNEELTYDKQFSSLRKKDIQQIFNRFPEINHLIISSVTKNTLRLPDIAKDKLDKLIYLNENTPLPIVNKYKTPETLGKDRIAAIVGANNIFPGENVLAIDAGTAITFDFINKNGEYSGGNISPGLSMRFNALNYFTSKLPLLKPDENFPFIGTSTGKAIIAGVQNGIIFEIDGYIDTLSEQYEDLKVILTGGDTFFFAHKLKNRIFAKPFLVALGLNRILEYNVKKI